MDIRSILVSVGLGQHRTATNYASQLAERFGAELVGIAAAEPSLLSTSIEGTSAATDYYALERKNIETMLERAEGRFRASVPASLPVKWRSYVADPTQMLIEQSRRCDLVVVASDDQAGIGAPVDAGHLILACGRPVIVAREAAEAATLDRVVVAWKDTREARRAVSDAVPLLQAAKQVKLVTHTEGDVPAETSSLHDVAEWLSRHGVSATSHIIERRAGFIEDLDQMAEEAPDLIVAGGYGHSRFREWLLGGMTANLIATNSISRLFSN